MVERSDSVHLMVKHSLTQQAIAVEVVLEVSIPHTPSHTLRRLLLRVRQQDAIHLRPQADELENGPTGCLILELAEDLLVDQREVWMVGRVVAGVELVSVGEHVSVDVSGGDLVAERVGVREEEACPPIVLRLHVSVMELIHESLTELQDREAGVDGSIEHKLRLQQVDGGHRLELLEGVKLWSRTVLSNRLRIAHQLDIGPFPKVLHSLPKDGIVEKLEKVLLKRVDRLFPLFGIEFNVWLEPCRLCEGQDAVDGCQLHTEAEALLQIAIVQHIVRLIA